MRILLFSGKGGVGKTSIAAATGLRLSRLGYRTLVMSVDPAHSLADAFDFETSLFQDKTNDPYPIDGKLSIQEVNIQREIKRHWREISTYVVSVLRTTGISEVEAEELAILPGMEELSAMMYVNQFRREQRYDIIVLDCAPTAESLRFVSMPTTLEWYMKHIFPFQRGLLKAVRPLANRVSPVELPSDSYFANVQSLFARLDGIGEVMEDSKITSVLYEDKEDPAAITRTEAPYRFEKNNSHYEVHLKLPFAAKGEVGLFKKGDELVVQVGTLRRHIGLPTSMAGLTPTKAKLENKQ